MSESVVSDSTCLIALHNIRRLDVLRQSFQRIIVPPAVAAEFGISLPWIQVMPPADVHMLAIAMTRVDAGEAEAISLAYELRLTLTVDDQKARRVAAGLGLVIIGTAGLLLRAKRLRIISEIRPVLAELRGAGFFLSETVIERILAVAQE